MKRNGANSIFGILISGFLLLSVACSHTRTANNELDGLNGDLAATTEAEREPTEVEEEVLAAQPVADAQTADEAAVPQADDFAVPGDEVAVTPETAVAPEKAEAAPAEASSQVLATIPAEADDMMAVVEADLKAALESEPVPVSTATVTAKSFSPKSSEDNAPVKVAEKKSDLSELTKMVAGSVGSAPAVEKSDSVTTQNFAEAEAAAVIEPASEQPLVEEPKAQMASSDLSQLLERNLWWVVSALALGALWVFFVVRKNRKARMDSSPF